MLKRPILILLLLLSAHGLFAQKKVQKQWNASGIDTLWIDSDVVYKVRISEGGAESIDLITSIEGEYFEAVTVDTKITGRTLKIDTGFSPFFKPKNDKLAAHKVLSIEMILQVPENLAVVIRSKSASVSFKGSLSFLETALENGNCELMRFRGNARLYSVSGNITVDALSNVGGRAISEEGNMYNELELEGAYFIEAKSRRGSVSLRRFQQ
ncbi:hypothetical protein C5O00_05950 [Pukyongia salina]|uniref:Auto-transporter adhesin head GIN domain-containing protein n=1 Tax=Pukyongia salina TaxID=2094025 RepID=A0A2S0HVU1_9FLAO|nr:hypothetical protein [Pukyongia salina]AVI50738.1 hypothetical protein C5O00_05950 [Pukyongia salina]